MSTLHLYQINPNSFCYVKKYTSNKFLDTLPLYFCQVNQIPQNVNITLLSSPLNSFTKFDIIPLANQSTRLIDHLSQKPTNLLFIFKIDDAYHYRLKILIRIVALYATKDSLVHIASYVPRTALYTSYASKNSFVHKSLSEMSKDKITILRVVQISQARFIVFWNSSQIRFINFEGVL